MYFFSIFVLVIWLSHEFFGNVTMYIISTHRKTRLMKDATRGNLYAFGVIKPEPL